MRNFKEKNICFFHKLLSFHKLFFFFLPMRKILLSQVALGLKLKGGAGSLIPGL